MFLFGVLRNSSGNYFRSLENKPYDSSKETSLVDVFKVYMLVHREGISILCNIAVVDVVKCCGDWHIYARSNMKRGGKRGHAKICRMLVTGIFMLKITQPK